MNEVSSHTTQNNIGDLPAHVTFFPCSPSSAIVRPASVLSHVVRAFPALSIDPQPE